MRARGLRRLGERGGSMVEFAIMAPVLVSIVLYATFFHDAIKAKLKTQEAANFAVWEMTSLPMSAYNHGGSNAGHAALMSAAQTKINADLGTTYQALDSADPSHTYANTFIGKHQLLGGGNIVWTDVDVPLASGDTLTGIGLGGLGGQLGSFANKGLDFALGAFDFDRKGLITVTVSSQFDNVILPHTFLDHQFANTKLSPLTTIKFTEKAALVVDDWAVNDGSDVDLKHASGNIYGTRGSSSATHPMAKQVSRMAFLGLDNFVPGLQDFSGFMGKLLPDPLGVPVVSMNYYKKNDRPHSLDEAFSPDCKTSSGNDHSAHGCVDMRQEGRDVDIGVVRFHTAPLRTTFRYDDSPSSQVFDESGPWYMGCPDPQQADPTTCHHANY